MNQPQHDLGQALLNALAESFAAQTQSVEAWHKSAPKDGYSPPQASDITLKTLKDTILGQHYMNFKLWHIEDEVRRRDVSTEVIAQCKRDIDACNQARNDRMEAVDFCLLSLLRPLLPDPAIDSRTGAARTRYNTEPPGLAVDRLSILALKIYHMREQARRPDADAAHREACRKKLEVLLEQRQDISQALLDLISEYLSGNKQPKLYFQFKMYNDPALNPAVYKNLNQKKIL